MDATAGRSGWPAWLRLSRPRQWTKNVLVLAAPGAAGVLHHPDVAWRTAVMLVAFCLASSGTYWVNDALDVEADRRHPRKRHRPVAAGLVPMRVAQGGGVGLILAGAAVAAGTGRAWAAGIVAAYAVLTLAYSLALKRLAVVDLVVVAFGFVLRAVGGAIAASVAVSNWFLLCTSFGSLLIVTGKRFGELVEVTGGRDGSTRSTLLRYDTPFLRTVLAVATGSCLVSYCLWAFEKANLPGVDHHLFELSIVPMATALLRYVLVVETGAGSAPEEVFLADRTLQVTGLIWLGLFGTGVAIG
jgi:decaprenyl-phosphate phosphoribosyltransferase